MQRSLLSKLSQQQRLSRQRAGSNRRTRLARPFASHGAPDTTGLDRQRLERLLAKSPPSGERSLTHLATTFLDDVEDVRSTEAAVAVQQLESAAAVSAEAFSCQDEHLSSSGGSSNTASNGLLAKLQEWAAKLPISKRARGLILCNVLVLLVATNWVVVKEAGTDFDPFGFAFLRFGVAAAAFSPFLLRAAGKKELIAAGLELGIWTAAGYVTQALGLVTTDASRASFLSTFTVLVVPFLAGIAGRGVRPITWAAAFGALFGVSLLEQSGTPPGMGDVWSFLSAVAFGVQVYRTEHWARRLKGSDTMGLMAVQLASTMAWTAAAAVVANPHAVQHLVMHPYNTCGMLASGHFPWKEVLYTGILTTDVALVLELCALRDIPSTDAAIIYTLEPVLGAGFAWMFL